jgi:hypothetical protein
MTVDREPQFPSERMRLHFAHGHRHGVALLLRQTECIRQSFGRAVPDAALKVKHDGRDRSMERPLERRSRSWSDFRARDPVGTLGRLLVAVGQARQTAVLRRPLRYRRAPSLPGGVLAPASCGALKSPADARDSVLLIR